jgi:micrococcal nuclease
VALLSRAPSLGAIALLAILVVVLVSGGDDDAPTGGSEPASPGPGEAHGIVVQVVDVVDGDTIEVLLGGTEEDVRYIGVDTPESVKPDSPVECFGPQASDFNEGLVGGEEVRLVFDAERRDDYGRLLAYVYVDDRLVNAELIRRGLARTLEIAPNTSKAPRLARLEARAGRAGRGLWGPSVC